MERRPKHIGIMAALAPELGEAANLERGERPFRVTTAVSGVGKVAAAREATRLISSGVDLILVVGTCGGLRLPDKVGTLVHLAAAIQWDLSVREGRQSGADEGVLQLWEGLVTGQRGVALTADRPAIRWLSRARRARAFAKGYACSDPSQGPGHGGCAVADMETAAVGAVAGAFDVPWAGLRVVSDARRSISDVLLRKSRAKGSFQANFARVAAQPAASLPALLDHLAEG